MPQRAIGSAGLPRTTSSAHRARDDATRHHNRAAAERDVRQDDDPGPTYASSSITTEGSVVVLGGVPSMYACMWAMIVTRMPIEARSLITIRLGFAVSSSASCPIETPSPIVTPRSR